MEPGYSKEQLQKKLNSWIAFNPNHLNFIGKINRQNTIKRITKKLKNYVKPN